MKNSFEIVQGALENFFNTAAAFLPNLIGALIILIVGWIIAKMIKWAVRRILTAINLDGITEKVGINSFLKKGGMTQTSTGVFSSLIYWVIMLAVLNAFFNSLGLEVVSNLLNQVILYIPNIIIACLLLVVGMYLSEFVSGLVVGALRGAKFENAELMGKIASYAILFFVVSIVLTQLGIGEEIIETIVGIVLGALGLALALAFGLGGREWAARVLDKYVHIK